MILLSIKRPMMEWSHNKPCFLNVNYQVIEPINMVHQMTHVGKV